MKASRAEVVASVNSERNYQDAKGSRAHGSLPPKSLEQYAFYMQRYMIVLQEQITTTWGDDANERSGALDTMRKITALGFAAMEEHGAPLRFITQEDMDRGMRSNEATGA